MRQVGPGARQQEAATTVVDEQITQLLGGIEKKETAEVLPKTCLQREADERRAKRRVVVTGMGAVTPLGLTVDEYW